MDLLAPGGGVVRLFAPPPLLAAVKGSIVIVLVLGNRELSAAITFVVLMFIQQCLIDDCFIFND